MADSKISDLSSVTTCATTDKYLIDAGGTDLAVSRGELVKNIAAASRGFYGDQYFGSPEVGLANVIPQVDRLCFSPIWVVPGQQANRIAINITTSHASGEGRLGIYNHDASTGQPGTLLQDVGTVDCTTTGIKEIVIDQTFTSAQYWLAAVFNSSTVACRGIQNSVAFRELSQGVSANLQFNTLQTYVDHTYGALPGTFSGPMLLSSLPRQPYIMLRNI